MTAELSGHIRFTGENQAVSTMQRINVAVKETATNLGKFLTRAELSEIELGRLQRGLVAVDIAAKGLKGGFETGITLMGRWMAGSSALAGVMGAAANSFGNYSTKLAEVSTLLPAGVSAFDKYDNAVKHLAVSSAQAADVVAGGLYQALSAGVPEENVVAFLGKASDLAVGGVTDLTTSVDGLTNVMNAYGLGLDKADRISAVYFNTMKAGKTTVGEVAANVGQLAPLAAQLGVSFEDLGSSWVSLTKVGGGTAAATTQLRAILVSLLKPTKESMDAAEEWGYKFNAASNIALLRSRGLTGALEEIQRMTGGSAERLGLLLPSVEALGGGMRLTSEEGKAAFVDAMKSMPRSAEQATAIIGDAVGKMKDDVGFKMRQIKEGMRNNWLEIGEGIIVGLAPNLDAAVAAVAGAGDEIKANTTAFASGIRQGLLASDIGDTVRKLFDTADSQKHWESLGTMIGRVTGEIVGYMGWVARAIDMVSDAVGSLGNALLILATVKIATQVIPWLLKLRGALLGVAAAGGAAGAGAAGGAAAGAGAGAAAGAAASGTLPAWLTRAAALGPAGLAITAGALTGGQMGTRIRDITLGETETGINIFDPKFIGNDQAGGAMVGRVWGAANNSYKTAELGGMLQRAAAGDASARRQLYAQGFGATSGKAAWEDGFGVNAARLKGAQMAAQRIAEVRQASTAREAAREAADMEQAKTEMAREALLSFEGIGDSFGRLGDRLGQVVEGSINRAKSTVETVLTLEVKDKRGGSRTARRKERGVGPALGPKVALSNYFVLTDDDEVLSIPDEFIYNMGPAQMAE